MATPAAGVLTLRLRLTALLGARRRIPATAPDGATARARFTRAATLPLHLGTQRRRRIIPAVVAGVTMLPAEEAGITAEEAGAVPTRPAVVADITDNPTEL